MQRDAAATQAAAVTAVMAAVAVTVTLAAMTDGPQPGSDSLSYQIAFAQTIQNDQQYIGDDGTLHVVGEIVNDRDAPLSGASVKVSMHDSEGRHILTKETSSLVHTIMPGMRGPFDLILANSNMPKQIMQGDVHYSLELDYNFAAPKSQVIDITESEMTRDRHNNLIIKGTVENKGIMTANTISVVATIYDNAGNVAAVTRIHPGPDYLRAGESSFFVVSIPDKEHTAGASRYDLVAESEEYAAVPEFPIGTVALLAGTFSAYVIVTRLSRLPMTNLISATGPR